MESLQRLMNKSYPKKEKQKTEASFSPSKQTVKSTPYSQPALNQPQIDDKCREGRGKAYPSSGQYSNIPQQKNMAYGAPGTMPTTYNVRIK
jgi:hypothetical protein